MESITDYLKQAFIYKNENNWEKALDYFYKALALDNDSIEIISELAHIYSKISKFDRACSLYEQILTKDSSNNKIKFDFACVYKQIKDFQKADILFSELFVSGYDLINTLQEWFPILLYFKEYEKIISIYKTSGEKLNSDIIMYYAGCAYLQNGNVEIAQNLFKESYELNENNLETAYSLAQILYNKKDYQQSEDILNKILNKSEDDRFFYLLGEIYFVRKYIDDAIKYYSFAVAINPKQAEYYYKLGIVYSLKGYFNEAEQSYCKAISLETNNITYNYTLAYMYYTNHKYELASKLTDFILSPYPENINAVSLKIILLIEKEDISSASKLVEKLISLKERDDFSWYAQELYFSKLNMWDKAVYAGNKALELNNESVEYKYELAKNYFYLENYKLSLKQCNEILEKNDKYLPAYILSAKILYNIADYQKAENLLNKAIRLDINNPDIYYLKGRIKFSISDYEEAINNFKIALSINPKEIKYYGYIAKSYYMLKDYSNAYLYYKEAADIDISSAEYRYYMAKCSEELNDKDNALTNYFLMKRLAPLNIFYLEEYANYYNKIGDKKSALDVLKSSLKKISLKEDKDKLKKIIDKIKKGG